MTAHTYLCPLFRKIIVFSDKTLENVYIIGKAATGKTTTMLALAEYLNQHSSAKIIYNPRMSTPLQSLKGIYGQLYREPAVRLTKEKAIPAILERLEKENVILMLDYICQKQLKSVILLISPKSIRRCCL